MTILARERFARWVSAVCGSQQAAATKLGCTQSQVSKVILGQRRPQLEFVLAVEAATAGWDGGVIRPVDWSDRVAAEDVSAVVADG